MIVIISNDINSNDNKYLSYINIIITIDYHYQ